jgi:hypothetical protein
MYNISVVGGATYFFSLYGAQNTQTFVLLRCLGIFISATLPVLIIMIPKIMIIQLKGFLIAIFPSLYSKSHNSNDSASQESHISIHHQAQLKPSRDSFLVASFPAALATACGLNDADSNGMGNSSAHSGESSPNRSRNSFILRQKIELAREIIEADARRKDTAVIAAGVETTLNEQQTTEVRVEPVGDYTGIFDDDEDEGRELSTYRSANQGNKVHP